MFLKSASPATVLPPPGVAPGQPILIAWVRMICQSRTVEVILRVVPCECDCYFLAHEGAAVVKPVPHRGPCPEGKTLLLLRKVPQNGCLVKNVLRAYKAVILSVHVIIGHFVIHISPLHKTDLPVHLSYNIKIKYTTLN